jgi:hypothetical protein
MPTGYTQIIEDGGCKFEDYAIKCAEAFLAESRDKDGDESIPRVKNFNPYNKLELEKWEKKMIELKLLTQFEIADRIEKERLETIKRHKDTAEAYRKETENYEAMLKEIGKWKPPTKDHKPLKQFMIQQIELCITRKPYERKAPDLVDAKEWLKTEEEFIQKNIDSHEKAHKNELKRIANRNKWVGELFDSLI